MATLKSSLILSLVDNVSRRARGISSTLNGLQAQSSSLIGLTSRLAAFGGAYIGVREGVSGTLGAAMEFESAFADVRKVVEASDEQFQNMSRTIKAMSRELPMTSVEIAQLFAAAGESGVATQDLKAFAEMASRVGIAFDMSAENAGESLAKLKTQFGLTVAETGDLADSINHLSNNMASKASAITDYLLRVGSLAEMGGFAKEEIAGIGSAMIAAGAQAETAGTAMQNVVKALTRGSSAKKSQRDAARALGLDLPALAKQMQKDAPKALKSVLTAISKQSKDRHLSLLSDFFGDEAKAFAPLVGNIGLLDQALDSVADKTKYSGSAFREYVARANTTSNALQILRNKIAYVFEDMGEDWLPTIKEGAGAIGEVLDTLGQRASIFDKAGASLRGFAQGLGYNGGVGEVIRDLGDLLFGKADGNGAADTLGRLFAKFEGYGKAIREFKDSLKDNPIAQFFGELAGKGLKLALAAGAISMVAGAITTLATALARITGITTAIGIMRAVGKIGGILKDVPIPQVPGGDSNPTRNDKPSSGWPVALKGVMAAFQMFDAYAGMPSTKEGIEELYKKNREGAGGLNRWLDSVITTPSEWFRRNDNSSHPYRQADDGGRAASLDAYLAGPNGGKPVVIDSSSIAAMNQPSGVQQVAVTNHERPHITVHAPVTISNISSPEGAVEAAASRLGQAAKSAVESSFSGGGGF
ncbi:phage tail tape measure protein [Shinella oryzae]|uniref:Phage tail tape measure protein n=1 Tax=Shinella oryzae TaxID=2871820 RepID=A0ABY9K550_9HYPH|nr:phage tail tape measure protein [Shinella oryzae]WLS03114.1 phage tail tape measure protein [Shinella oryzae]